MSIQTAKVERKFLSTEKPFSTQIKTIDAAASRFPKILAMYLHNQYRNENGTLVHEWEISDSKELKITAAMYYKRYNISSK